MTPQCRTKGTNVRCLYHNRNRLSELRDQLLKDLRDRLASFSLPITVITPVFSTIDGSVIRFPGESSLEQVSSTLLDMILLEPVDWHSVQTRILGTIKEATANESVSCDILNFGPGYGMSSKKFSLPDHVRILDVSAANIQHNMENPRSRLSGDTDIAIVGMGVDLPGATDAATLWDNLMAGVNTCSEVGKHINWDSTCI